MSKKYDFMGNPYKHTKLSKHYEITIIIYLSFSYDSFHSCDIVPQAKEAADKMQNQPNFPIAPNYIKTYNLEYCINYAITNNRKLYQTR